MDGAAAPEYQPGRMKRMAFLGILLLAGCGEQQVTAFECREVSHRALEDGLMSTSPERRASFILDRKTNRFLEIATPDLFGDLCEGCRLTADERFIRESGSPQRGDQDKRTVDIDRVAGAGQIKTEIAGSTTYRMLDHCHGIAVPDAYFAQQKG